MKRKIIKHGPSSYIVSLPLSWIKKYNVEKGDEVSVEEKGNDIVVSSSLTHNVENIDLDTSKSKNMTSEIVQALYKKGIDEINVSLSGHDHFRTIIDSLEHELMGYEIISSTKSTCLIKCITKYSKEFDNVLRRVFLVTIALGEEGMKMIEEKNFDTLSNIIILEKSNNKLTTYCRRYINKYNVDNFDKIGPLYYIIELLEKIADEYRYLYSSVAKLDFSKVNLDKELLATYHEINHMLRTFYECFYKFDYSKVNEIKKIRDKLLVIIGEKFKKIKTRENFCLYHHSCNLIEKTFALLDPYLVLAMNEKV